MILRARRDFNYMSGSDQIIIMDKESTCVCYVFGTWDNSTVRFFAFLILPDFDMRCDTLHCFYLFILIFRFKINSP